jgi:adenine-specific DNA-methyltransferase
LLRASKFIWFDEEFDDDINNYKKEDEKGKFKTVRLAKWGSGARKEDRPTMHFPIISPDANEVLPIAPDGNDGRWRVGKKTMDKLINKNSIYWEKSQDRWIAYEKVYFNSEKSKKIKFRSILYNIASTGDGTNQLKELFGVKDVFQNPKPIEVISSFLKNNTEEEDVILDFFGGSGTTAHAVLELNKEDSGNRKFILVQLPEQCDEDSEAYKSGYKTIADIAKERIRRVIKNLTPHSPLLKERGRGERREGSYAENLFKGASPTLFENANKLRKNKTNAEESLWQAIRNKEIENCKFRRQHPIGQFIADFYCHEKKLVIEIDGGYHNETEQKTYDQARTQAINEFGVRVIRFTNEEILNSLPRVLKQISETLDSPSHLTSSPLSSRRGDGGEAYSINNNELIIALDTMNEKLVERIIAAKPQKVITLDSLFTGNDQLKTNTVLQMRDAGIDFKTI